MREVEFEGVNAKVLRGETVGRGHEGDPVRRGVDRTHDHLHALANLEHRRRVADLAAELRHVQQAFDAGGEPHERAELREPRHGAAGDLADLHRAVDRVPVFEELEVNPSRAWAGLYEMTPDHHPVLGAAPGVNGFYFANGFSGHGVMHSPATGKILADLILKGSTDLIDAKLLDYARFAEGRQIEETAVFSFLMHLKPQRAAPSVMKSAARWNS